MALRKKPQKRANPQNPNKVLVVFLVIFILATIITGVACYYGYAEQAKLREDAKKAVGDVASIKKQLEWREYQAQEARAALGFPLLVQEGDIDEQNLWQVGHEDFVNPDGTVKDTSKFKGEKTKDVIAQMIKKNVELLKWNAGAKKYEKTYTELLKERDNQIRKLQGDLSAAVDAKKKAEDQFALLEPKYKAFFEEEDAKIEKANAAALRAAMAKYAQMDTMLAANNKLKADISQAEAEHARALRAKDSKILELNAQVDKLKSDIPTNIITARPSTDVHSLALDISSGKPFWDRPQGKVLRIEEQGRKLYINLGSAKGVKPQLTFNVFGAGWNGKAEGGLKGTIEVVSVLDANTAMAQVTSLFDSEGRELVLNDSRRGGLQRQADFPMKEGDLLYNLVWGTHVAIAGAVEGLGYDAQGPAEQVERLVALLKDKGVKVDAYLDLRTGQIKGSITARTNYLIRGDVPESSGTDAGGKASKDLQENLKAMKNEAADKGLFVISPDNFLMVIGYRRPRSGNDLELSGFRPTVPAAGVTVGGPTAGGEQKENP